MDCKRVIASGARGAMLLAFVLVSSAGSLPARAADPPELSNATVHGLEGHRIKLAAPQGGATVLIFYSTECPISNSYSPTLKSLVESFPGREGEVDRRVR